MFYIQDLLNVIHRFASEFYHERGQLLNISRQYRREKKERDLRRLGLSSGFDDYDTPGSSSDSTSVSEESSDENSSESEMDEDEEGDGQDEEKDEPSSNAEDKDEDEETRTANNNKSKTRSDTKGNSKGKGKQKQKAKQNGPTSRRRVSRKGTKIKRDDNLYIDMYKMFDGSAMMALGMSVFFLFFRALFAFRIPFRSHCNIQYPTWFSLTYLLRSLLKACWSKNKLHKC